jgi:hypothetical protein
VPLGDFSRIVPTMIQSALAFRARRPRSLTGGSEEQGCSIMKKTYDPVATAISAIDNVSLIPATPEDVRRMLSTGEGEPSHVMALFSDVSYATLLRLAIVFGISDDDFARAYIHARDNYAAANPGFDAFVLEMEAVWEAEKA